MIKPAIGQKVWYFASGTHYKGFKAGEPDNQPYDATVIFVNNDSEVNLLVVNHMGGIEAKLNVNLVQEGDVHPTGSHARWMPYQVGQAQKNEVK